jgi:DNA-binding CsgD family transcriptional regulator
VVKSGAPGARATRRAEPFLARLFERMLRPRRRALDTLGTEELIEEEKRVLELLALGRGAGDLVAELAMSSDTVRGHVLNASFALDRTNEG